MNASADPAFRLLNDYQRNFPLLPRPFRAIGEQVGLAEAAVIDSYRDFLARGVVSRIGAVLPPQRVGVSTLAALAVPADALERVAALVTARAQVNHNYQREHRFNLWFVLAARDEAALEAQLRAIAEESGCPLISLPLRESFHIDLGFDLAGGCKHVQPDAAVPGERACALPELERGLLAALEPGLPVEPRPFKVLGERAGLSEAFTLELLERWLDEGLVKRLGVVVRHHELGYIANAMCVWDVPDAVVSELGRRLAGAPGITLCYRRQRALPDWPYNLFCMIHGKAREEVLALRDDLARRHELDQYPHAVLFSTRRFKQQGARYLTGECCA
ncbi:AsnC family transcriptional regulator [Denitratisoma sp. DHT3]|uniref:siroheme decarboxylase subunit beta n=1 Tax=Denitratisoma sp. DHT3 TaxID=1981880 RepID=UPI0011983682|nr:Lrp/AsnC family transcriptional regulator [Denitratisoma sp. DHT3]QDX81190.1 AsnC family transcriptional regulator [Denitratisoma sp. DHT3]